MATLELSFGLEDRSWISGFPIPDVPVLKAGSRGLTYPEGLTIYTDHTELTLAQPLEIKDIVSDIIQDSSHAKMLQEEALKEMEARRRMRATIVPTGVDAVKRVLRTTGEPVTLFGERPVSCRLQVAEILD